MLHNVKGHGFNIWLDFVKIKKNKKTWLDNFLLKR